MYYAACAGLFICFALLLRWGRKAASVIESQNKRIAELEQVNDDWFCTCDELGNENTCLPNAVKNNIRQYNEYCKQFEAERIEYTRENKALRDFIKGRTP